MAETTSGGLVGAQIVQYDDVPPAQRRYEDVADIGQKNVLVRRSVDGHARGLAVSPNRPDERAHAPMAVWCGVMDPFTPQGPAVEAGHLRRDAGFVDEDELR